MSSDLQRADSRALHDELLNLTSAQQGTLILRLNIGKEVGGASPRDRANQIFDFMSRNKQRIERLREELIRFRVEELEAPKNQSDSKRVAEQHDSTLNPPVNTTPLTLPSPKKLREELLGVIHSLPNLMVILEDAEIKTARINLSGALEICMHNVLRHVKAHGVATQLRLYQTVKDEYPEAALPQLDQAIRVLGGGDGAGF